MIIAKVLGRLGLPFLLRFVGKSLSIIDDDIAGKASKALLDVNTAIEDKKISLEQVGEANRHLEAMENIDIKTLVTINETIRQELQSEDRFVRFWRPCFGYAVSISWVATMLTICYLILSGNENAEKIIMALVETTSLWGIALGVLGVSVVKRSQEKNRSDNILNKILDR